MKELILTYEGCDDTKDPKIPIQPFVIRAIVKEPRLELNIIAPRIISHDEIFDITMRVENIGEGEAFGIVIGVPIDRKFIISGYSSMAHFSLPGKTAKDLKITVKAPHKGSLKIGSPRLSYADVEGNFFESEIRPVEISMAEIRPRKRPLPTSIAEIGIIKKRWLVVRKIGGGAYADTYVVRNRATHERMVLKLINPALTKDAVLLHHFAEEAAMAAGLHHPNLMAVYDFDFLYSKGARYPYVVTEFIGGRTLQEALQSEQIALPSVCHVLADISKALDYLHKRRLVHGDIKPSNIISDTSSKLWKLADFGLSSQWMTSFQCTPYYSSPEAISASSLTPESDIYSLGCVLKEMLTGSPKGNLSQIRKEHLEYNRWVAMRLGNLAERMTSQKLSERPNAVEVYVEATITWPIQHVGYLGSRNPGTYKV